MPTEDDRMAELEDLVQAQRDQMKLIQEWCLGMAEWCEQLRSSNDRLRERIAALGVVASEAFNDAGAPPPPPLPPFA